MILLFFYIISNHIPSCGRLCATMLPSIVSDLEGDVTYPAHHTLQIDALGSELTSAMPKNWQWWRWSQKAQFPVSNCFYFMLSSATLLPRGPLISIIPNLLILQGRQACPICRSLGYIHLVSHFFFPSLEAVCCFLDRNFSD